MDRWGSRAVNPCLGGEIAKRSKINVCKVLPLTPVSGDTVSSGYCHDYPHASSLHIVINIKITPRALYLVRLHHSLSSRCKRLY